MAKSHAERVERVQHKFLMWLNCHTSQPCLSLTYHSLLQHFGVQSLTSRRVQHDLLFLKSIFSLKISSEILLNCFGLHAPTRSTRNLRLFAEPRGRVETVASGFLCRMPRLANKFLAATSADFFDDTVSTLRTKIVKYAKNMRL